MAAITKKRQLGRQVSIVGAGMTSFGAFQDLTSRDLFAAAFQDLLDHMDQGIDVEDIECGYLGNYSSDLFERQGHTAPIIADWLGMTPVLPSPASKTPAPAAAAPCARVSWPLPRACTTWCWWAALRR